MISYGVDHFMFINSRGIRLIWKKINSTKFWLSARKMASGVAVAQILALVSIPILTRIFSSEVWGVAGSVVAAASFLSVAFTLRYELAVVLAENMRKANALVILCFLSMAFLFLVSMVSLFLLDSFTPYLIQSTFFDGTIYFIPLIALLMSMVSTLNFYCTRVKDFGTVSISLALQQSFYMVSSGVFSLFAFAHNGLILGKVVALIVTIFWMSFKSFSYSFFDFFRRGNLNIIGVAKEYFRFPLYSLPYSLLVVSSKETFLIMLAVLFEPKIAGAFVLARMLIAAPVSLVASIFGQLLFNEFIKIDKLGRPTKNLILLLKILFFGFAPFYITAGISAEDLFKFLFGVDWLLSSMIFSLLLPSGFLMLFTSWMDRIFEVKKMQKRLFLLQLSFEFCTILGLLGIAILYSDFQLMVLYFGIMTFTFNLVFLVKAASLIGLFKRPLKCL